MVISLTSGSTDDNDFASIIIDATDFDFSDLTGYKLYLIADAESASIRRSNETGLPFGESNWVNRLAKKLKLNLTIRPRGRQKKQVVKATKKR